MMYTMKTLIKSKLQERIGREVYLIECTYKGVDHELFDDADFAIYNVTYSVEHWDEAGIICTYRIVNEEEVLINLSF